jgi:hypothetical protein
MSFLFKGSPPPDSVVITDPTVWNALSEEEKRAHLQRIKEVRLDCRAYSAFTLRGNRHFLGLSAIGGVLSSLAPPQWPMGKRIGPFLVLGLAGIWLDNAAVTRECEVSDTRSFEFTGQRSHHPLTPPYPCRVPLQMKYPEPAVGLQSPIFTSTPPSSLSVAPTSHER